MGEIDERLERGVAVFRRAGDDPALLGAALLAFHGALEGGLDAALADLPDLPADDRATIAQRKLTWLRRAALAEQHKLLSSEARTRALDSARARIGLMRGDACDWSAADVQELGRLAANVCGRRELLRQIDQRAERARTTVATAPPIWGQEAEQRRIPTVRIIATLVFLAAFAGVMWVIYQQIDGPRLLRALGAIPAPTPAPVEFNADPTPTPPLRRTTITGLNGGPGWLHVTASFDSPTRAIQLADGMQVTLRDQQQTDGNNVRWQLVEAGGYEGWCPAANLALGP